MNDEPKRTTIDLPFSPEDVRTGAASPQLPFSITFDDMIREIDEELGYRAHVFPKRMQGAGLALRNQLQRRLEVMRAIKAHLERVRDHQ